MEEGVAALIGPSAARIEFLGAIKVAVDQRLEIRRARGGVPWDYLGAPNSVIPN
jgi:hypothetical protein